MSQYDFGGVDWFHEHVCSTETGRDVMVDLELKLSNNRVSPE
jgi:hypothetical protein